VPVASITGIEAGQLFFQTVAGGQGRRPINQIVRLRVDADPALTAAEEAYQARRFDVATTDYLKAMKSSANRWMRQWSAPRLLESAQQAKRFDAAATAYVQMMVNDPASAGGAKLVVPTAAAADQIAAAIGETTSALKNPQLSAESKAGLEKFLAELQRIPTASATPGAAPASPAPKAIPPAAPAPASAAPAAAGGNPAAPAGSSAKARLDAAAAALARKDFTGAMTAINADRAAFVQPPDQAQALFLLAEAQAGLAESSIANPSASSAPASADPARAADDARKDAAIAYLRVAAQAKDSPLAAPALLKAAAIEEHLKDLPGARTLYQQVATEFANTPSAEQAKQAMSRLAASH
jgi:TolA-binding protein